MRSSALAVVGALVVIGGAAAIGYAVTRKATGGMSMDQTAAMSDAVAKLDAEIQSARTAVRERAATLSTLLAVRRAIVTDAQTAADMVKGGELQFTPSNGEILELGRVIKTNGIDELLMLQPPNAMRTSHSGKTGAYAELVREQIVITEVAEVAPVGDADYRGYLSVTRPLALAPMIQPLVAAGIAGKLVIGDASAPIGQMPAGAATRERPLAALDGAKLIAADPPPRAVMPLSVLVGGIGAAIAGLLLLVIGMLSRRDGPPSRILDVPPHMTVPPQPGFAPTAVAPAVAMAPTQVSQQMVAAGTPSTHGMGTGSRIQPSNIGRGAMIGRWEVVRRLGSGGMADVFLAQSRGEAGFEKLVAIKVMHGHLARNDRAVDHFLDEARLAARIHHPNVVAIQDLGKIGEDYVIVMEYVDGVDLERLLISAREGRRDVPLPVALGILCRICDGLDAAHRATSPDGVPLGIIHRDIKSANVLVSRQGVVKVVDFGIAKAAKQAHVTFAGETKGTPSMMAPEQRVGEQVDVRADVYSVSAVGYELVTGQGVNLDLAALAHLGVDNWPHLPPPSSLRPGLPTELDPILLDAMAFERTRRPSDCAAFEAMCQSVIRTYNLVTTDKDIGRWVESELRFLQPTADSSMASTGKPSIA